MFSGLCVMGQPQVWVTDVLLRDALPGCLGPASPRGAQPLLLCVWAGLGRIILLGRIIVLLQEVEADDRSLWLSHSQMSM